MFRNISTANSKDRINATDISIKVILAKPCLWQHNTAIDRKAHKSQTCDLHDHATIVTSNHFSLFPEKSTLQQQKNESDPGL